MNNTLKVINSNQMKENVINDLRFENDDLHKHQNKMEREL